MRGNNTDSWEGHQDVFGAACHSEGNNTRRWNVGVNLKINTASLETI